MRLICPNCDANYEVDDNVIPLDGRDVQCSNCGHTWFQRSPLQSEEPEPVSEPVAEPEPAPVTEPEDTPVQEEEVAADTSDDEAPADSEMDQEATEEGEAPRQELDEAVLDILRQEAEYESKARAQEGGDGDEVPLGAGQPGPDPVVSRTAKLRGESPDVSESGARRDLLPDIEEINSTLRAASDRVEEEGEEPESAAAQPVRRSGFRRGFLLMILLFVIAACVYIYAAKIAIAVPALEGVMEAYVNWVNGVRLWLDGLMSSAVDSMSGFTQDGSG